MIWVYTASLSHLEHYFHYSDPANDEKICKFLYGKSFDVQIALTYLIPGEELVKWMDKEMSLEDDDDDGDNGESNTETMRTVTEAAT